MTETEGRWERWWTDRSTALLSRSVSYPAKHGHNPGKLNWYGAV